MLASTHTPGTLALVRNLISGRPLTRNDVDIINSFLCAGDATPLRLAVWACYSGCGIGTARQVRFLLDTLGYPRKGYTSEEIAAMFRRAYERTDRHGAWIDPTELSSSAREVAGFEAKEEWRRAAMRAFDAVRTRPMESDEQARAWSQVSARVMVLHLVGVRVAEVENLEDVVRSWLPVECRAAA